MSPRSGRLGASATGWLPRGVTGVVWLVLAAVLAAMLYGVAQVTVAHGDGGDYSIDFSAARPGTYERLTPNELAPPGSGRVADPLPGASHANNVESLAPGDFGLGQIVPFELEISVANDAPAHDAVTFVAGWETETTSGRAFGYEGFFGVYAVFVDPADGSASGGDTDASALLIADPVVGTQIQGTIMVTGLDPGEHVIVEIWVVLQENITETVTGNVQSRLLGAETSGTVEAGDRINTGDQTVPLRKVGEFFRADVDVSVTKTDSQDPVEVGQDFDYILTVTNSGPSVANGVQLVDTLDPNTSFVSAAVDADHVATTNCQHDSGIVTCDVGFLSPGETVTITVTVHVDALPTPDPILVNSVVVTTISHDTDESNNSAEEPTAVLGSADLAVTKSDSPDPVVAGTNLTYTIDVTNSGPNDATNVVVTDDTWLPTDTTFVNAGTPSQGSFSAGTGIWTVGSLANGASATLAVTVLVGADVAGGTILTNTVTVGGDQVDPDPSNNSDTEPTTVETSADLAVMKSDSPDPVLAGSTLTYTVQVTNSGPSDAVNVVVTDTLPVGVTFESTSGCNEDPDGLPTCTLGGLAVGASTSYLITVSVDAETVGTITNTATVSADTPDGDTGNNSDSEDTLVIQPVPATGTVTITKVIQSSSGETPDNPARPAPPVPAPAPCPPPVASRPSPPPPCSTPSSPHRPPAPRTSPARSATPPPPANPHSCSSPSAGPPASRWSASRRRRPPPRWSPSGRIAACRPL